MLHNLIMEIRCALDAKLYYIALQSALTLPDICGNIDFPRDGPGPRYAKWYDQNVKHDPKTRGKWFTGYRAWQLRNGAIHALASPNPEGPIREPDRPVPIVFYNGHPQSDAELDGIGRPHMTLWGCPDDLWVYVVCPEKYCLEILQAVTSWLKVALEDPERRERLSELLQIEPAGTEPLFRAPAWAIERARKCQTKPISRRH